MRISPWITLVSSLFIIPFAQAESPPQAAQPAPEAAQPTPDVAQPAPQVVQTPPEAAQPAPQAAQPAPEAAPPAPQVAQPAPQVPQPAPQVAQPVMVTPAAALPNPWINPIPVPVLPTPGANPYLGQVPAAANVGLPFSFIPYLLPSTLPIPGFPQAPRKPYTMRPIIPEQARMQMMQMMMPMMNDVMHMSMPDAMNWMAYKIKAKPGLSFDDVIESMNLRANQLNFKHVGENLMWKDFKAVLDDQTAPRVEVHSYCDIKVGRDLLKISPEFLVFLPCRIGVMEDADKNIWLMMIDWNMEWIGGYQQSMGINAELENGARDIRQKMGDIMRAGANGDL